MVIIENQISVFGDPEEEISPKRKNIQTEGNHMGKEKKNGWWSSMSNKSWNFRRKNNKENIT